ncbi:unnamed protein product [Amoebophrya sp. A120]|nr:unnamed protein product [Amoebophrya sp. A120]|eukprot:GSA120T00007691001.1
MMAAGCTGSFHSVKNWRMYSLTRNKASCIEAAKVPAVDPSRCAVTYAGHCVPGGAYASEPLYKEAAGTDTAATIVISLYEDRAYNLNECRYLCANTDGCVSFFLQKAVTNSVRFCYLMRAGCGTSTTDTSWEGYDISSCALEASTSTTTTTTTTTTPAKERLLLDCGVSPAEAAAAIESAGAATVEIFRRRGLHVTTVGGSQFDGEVPVEFADDAGRFGSCVLMAPLAELGITLDWEAQRWGYPKGGVLVQAFRPPDFQTPVAAMDWLEYAPAGARRVNKYNVSRHVFTADGKAVVTGNRTCSAAASAGEQEKCAAVNASAYSAAGNVYGWEVNMPVPERKDSTKARQLLLRLRLGDVLTFSYRLGSGGGHQLSIHDLAVTAKYHVAATLTERAEDRATFPWVFQDRFESCDVTCRDLGRRCIAEEMMKVDSLDKVNEILFATAGLNCTSGAGRAYANTPCLNLAAGYEGMCFYRDSSHSLHAIDPAVGSTCWAQAPYDSRLTLCYCQRLAVPREATQVQLFKSFHKNWVLAARKDSCNTACLKSGNRVCNSEMQSQVNTQDRFQRAVQLATGIPEFACPTGPLGHLPDVRLAAHTGVPMIGIGRANGGQHYGKCFVYSGPHSYNTGHSSQGAATEGEKTPGYSSCRSSAVLDDWGRHLCYCENLEESYLRARNYHRNLLKNEPYESTRDWRDSSPVVSRGRASKWILGGAGRSCYQTCRDEGPGLFCDTDERMALDGDARLRAVLKGPDINRPDLCDSSWTVVGKPDGGVPSVDPTTKECYFVAGNASATAGEKVWTTPANCYAIPRVATSPRLPVCFCRIPRLSDTSYAVPDRAFLLRSNDPHWVLSDPGETCVVTCAKSNRRMCDPTKQTALSHVSKVLDAVASALGLTSVDNRNQYSSNADGVPSIELRHGNVKSFNSSAQETHSKCALVQDAFHAPVCYCRDPDAPDWDFAV